MASRIIRSSIVGLLLILLAAAAFVRIEQVGASAREVTFTRDIAPIFFNKCTECHRPGEIAPMSLLAYASSEEV
jgi:hypothetical protein